jgi:hypothetical protein
MNPPPTPIKWLYSLIISLRTDTLMWTMCCLWEAWEHMCKSQHLRLLLVWETEYSKKVRQILVSRLCLGQEVTQCRWFPDTGTGSRRQDQLSSNVVNTYWVVLFSHFNFRWMMWIIQHKWEKDVYSKIELTELAGNTLEWVHEGCCGIGKHPRMVPQDKRLGGKGGCSQW